MNGNDAFDPQVCNEKIVELGSNAPPVVLHRLAEVRRAKGIPRRVLARRLGITVQELRVKEESADVPISTLCYWASVLNVSVTELVVEPDKALSPTHLPRLQGARLMKVASKLRDRSHRAGIQRLAQTFVEQLAEILPDLEQVANRNHRRSQQVDGQRQANVPPGLTEQIFIRRRDSDEL